ncbi:MAG TPA: hypothetical protein VMS76_05860 [Planctomycetota bacterium]|nr:hypothetical protein [Planctomycetota bacterium]
METIPESPQPVDVTERSGASSTKRGWEKLLESFLQDSSILWLLSTGVLILLGSSMLLVTSHWRDITPAWKSLVLLGYTSAAFAGGHVSYFRLGLRRTGTVLLALTVLLIPLNFLALHWLFGAGQAASPGRAASTLLAWPLLALNGAFAWFAARRVFRHFLRGSQPTFLASYLILGAAGALAPVSPLPAGLTALVLWAVLAAGSLKVHRHVFWLVEEHRKPRIFGFFPLLLLGAQFVAVFALHLARSMTVPWLGLGCVLASVPIFLAADALGRVFEQRTGGIVRPIPAAIVLPLVLAVMLCIAGLCLAASGLWRGGDVLAMVPAAALTAGMLALAARRTGKEAITWGALAALTLAYNFSPAYFRETAARLVQSGARALSEERLPFAFYGLTYLPLLGALAAFGARFRGTPLETLARPARRFAVGLAAGLLALSFSHVKAPFPIGAALAGFFAATAMLFRDRWLLLPTIGSSLVAALGFTPFAAGVLGWRSDQGLPALAIALAAGALLIAGKAIDRRAAAWPTRATTRRLLDLDAFLPRAPLAVGSLVLTGLAALAWLVLGLPEAVAVEAMLGAGLISILLVLHSLRSRPFACAELAVVFPVVAAIACIAWRDDVNFHEVLGLAIAAAIAAWTVGSVCGVRGGRFARTFGPAAVRAGAVALSLGLTTLLPVIFVFDALRLDGEIGWVGSWHGLAASTLAVAWSFLAASRGGRRRFTWIGSFAALGWIAAITGIWFGLHALEWVPLVWTLAAVAALPCRSRLPGLARAQGAIFLAINLLAFLQISPHFTLAGLAALGGLILLATVDGRPAPFSLAAMAASWHGLAFVLHQTSGHGYSVLGIFLPPVPAALPLAALAALCALVWPHLGRSAAGTLAPVRWLHGLALRIVAGAGLLMSLEWQAITPFETALAITAFLALAITELRSACERADPRRAWAAEALVAAGISYLAWFDVIELGRGLSLYALALGAFALHGLSRLALRSEKTPVLARPLQQTALALPAAAIVLAIARTALGHDGPWVGARSLALFLAAGFYFWRGIEDRRPGLVAAACGIANAALLLLWRELAWSNPQLYLVPVGATLLALVEICRREIPAAWHNVLRYAGALIILTSPVPDLVAGEWIHLLSLMVLSTAVIFASLAVKARAMLYSGTAFLVADLITMVVRGTLQHVNLLWIFGLGLGALLIVVAALCENRREVLQAKLRSLAVRLESWS